MLHIKVHIGHGCQNVLKNANRKIFGGLGRPTKHGLVKHNHMHNLTLAPMHTKEVAYKTLVRPQLEHAVPINIDIDHYINVIQISKVEKVQRGAFLYRNGHNYRNGLPEWTLCYGFGCYLIILYKMKSSSGHNVHSGNQAHSGPFR